MRLTKDNLDKIEMQLIELFPLTPVPRVRLADALIMDYWGAIPPGLPEESWTSWLDISDELLNKYELLLTYFEGTDLIYFIPRFVLQIVKEGGVEGKVFSNATSSFMWPLALWQGRNYKDVPLNPSQLDFLTWVLKEACLNRDLRCDAYG